jgi:hypothetical protein
MRVSDNHVTREDAKHFLIVTALFAFFACGLWYVAATIAISMSFDNGFSAKMIIVDIIAVLLPIIFQIIPLMLSWLNMRKGNYARSHTILMINWFSAAIAVVLPTVITLSKMLMGL